MPALQDAPAMRGHSPDRERPLGSYAVLTGTFGALSAAFAAWLRSSDHELPDRVDPGDLALLTVSSHKLSRLITRDRVGAFARAPFTEFQDDAGHGEVDEAARGHGLRRAIGELLVCPYCLSLWIAAFFTAGLIVAPRATRWTMTVFTVLFGSDVLNLVYRGAADATS